MTRAERETVIIANLADLDDGFFTVETTEEGTYKRLRRMAGARLVLTETRDRQGRITSWLCILPSEFWKGLGIKATRQLSPEAKAKAVERGRQLGRQTSKSKSVDLQK